MVERCIVEGADSYILKPAALKELTALWGFVARRRRAISPDLPPPLRGLLSPSLAFSHTCSGLCGPSQTAQRGAEQPDGRFESGDPILPRRRALPSLPPLTTWHALCPPHSTSLGATWQVIRSVEEELGTANPKDSKQSGKAGSPSLAIKGGAANMAAAAFADVGGKKPGRKAVRTPARCLERRSPGLVTAPC